MSWRRELPGAALGVFGCLVLVVLGSRTGLAQVLDDAVVGDATPALLRVQGADGDAERLPRLHPGTTVARCMTVVYLGDSSTVLTASAADMSATHGLDHLIAVRLELTSGDNGSSCASRLPTRVLFAGPMNAFPRAGRHTPPIVLAGSGRVAASIRISYTFAASPPNSAQSGTAALRIQWSVQGA